MENYKKRIMNRLSIMVGFVFLFLIFILSKIVGLQYFEGDSYKKLSQDLTIKNDTIYANRGNVYASNGNLLATSMSKYTIRMDVMSVKSKDFEENIAGLSKSLSKMLGKSTYHYQNKLRQARKKKNRYLLIARNVGYNDYVKMKQFPIFNLGVYKGGFIAEQKTVRAHPIGKIAERTIGYDDHRGGAGIEGAFKDYLLGENGWRRKKKIAKGQWKPISDVNEKEPVDGRDVVTTIDVNIQDVTHHALLKSLEYFEADHGCAIVMEVATGEIKAISNLGRTSAGKYYEARNYAIWESHEPGSTFKLASLMASLEDNYVDTSTVVDTEKGRIYIHGKKVEDSHRGGYGKISVARAIEVSSNVGIVKVVRKHYDKNPQQFLKRLHQFGIGEMTNVKIKGEGKPYIPNPKDKKRWNKISLEWMAWGYGVSLTPLQILTFYNAIANKGEMVKPRFIKELRVGNKIEKSFEKEVVRKKIASDNTLRKVTKVLENIVKKGTADNIYSPHFSMAGKTGTAKKVVNGVYSGKHYVASFAGFFPVENPKYSCIVVVHSPDKKKGYYGAIVAAPVFKEIAQKIHTSTFSEIHSVGDTIHIDKVDKSYATYYNLLQNSKLIMPNLKGMDAMDAIAILENMGLKVKCDALGKVVEQSIKKGEKVTKGTLVSLKLS